MSPQQVDKLVQPLLGIGVCLFIFLMIYSRAKKQTMMESIKIFIEKIKEMRGEENK